MSNDWIEWEGEYGYRPEPPEAVVEVRFRSGQTAVGPCSEFGWRHSKSVVQSHADSDIVAYRVVPLNPVPEAEKPKADWIEWKGGKCPVHHNTLIEVRYRYGDTARGQAKHWTHCWQNDGMPADIVAYRVISEPAKPEAPSPNAHYRHGEIECIDAIRASLTDEEWRGYCKGNVMKYVWRERHKGGDDTLVKAQDYLRWAIAGKAEGKR